MRHPVLTAHRMLLRIGHPAIQLLRRIFRPPVHGVKCVVHRGDQIVLVRHTYGWRARWDLPGGALKRGETPVDGARREVREELGLEPRAWQPIGEARLLTNRRHVIHGFAGPAEQAELTPDPAEIAEARWFASSGLPERLAPYVRAFVDGHYSPRA